MQGSRVWFFPDGDRPPLGDSGMKGHESYVILNPNGHDAHVSFTLYFEDEEPVEGIGMVVPARRVRCFQTHNAQHFGEHVLPVARQYAAKVESDVPVVAQYGRLDARQENLAYYTTMGFRGE
ncbi:MAG TPA: sensory rhodopsin transducer [Candidatus Limnocylindria bacterium]|nr:sensory rhodopsin transducer [Candidatus Limnocylindria bacterium]